MNYETFKTSTVTSLCKYFGDQISVSLQPIIKNNNVKLDGLIIQDRSINVSPTIYLDYYYEDFLAGKSFSCILDEIIASYQNHVPSRSIDLSFFMDYDKIKYRIIHKLIHYEQNEEILKSVPHFRYLDLAVVFCCYLSDTPDGNASILIYNHHLKLWHISAEHLYDLAIKNTPILLPYELKSMEDTLKNLCPDLPMISMNTAARSGMYVLSNTEKLYGASTILYPNVLSFFAKSIGCDIYILPSSIHEVLLLPQDSFSHISDLNCIIKDINASQVLKEEILSDHAYRFEQKSGLVTF